MEILIVDLNAFKITFEISWRNTFVMRIEMIFILFFIMLSITIIKSTDSQFHQI